MRTEPPRRAASEEERLLSLLEEDFVDDDPEDVCDLDEAFLAEEIRLRMDR